MVATRLWLSDTNVDVNRMATQDPKMTGTRRALFGVKSCYLQAEHQVPEQAEKGGPRS